MVLVRSLYAAVPCSTREYYPCQRSRMHSRIYAFFVTSAAFAAAAAAAAAWSAAFTCSAILAAFAAALAASFAAFFAAFFAFFTAFFCSFMIFFACFFAFLAAFLAGSSWPSSDSSKEATVLKCDNRSAIAIASNDVHYAQTKRVAIKHHFIRSHFTSNTGCLRWVPTTDQQADILTKPLGRILFTRLRHHDGRRR
jgi:hypothetical protein